MNNIENFIEGDFPEIQPPLSSGESKSPDIIDVEPAEVKELESEKVEERCITVKTATPYNASINESNGKNIGSIYFLCKDENDKLFVIMKSYCFNSKDEAELSIYSLPFYNDYEIEFASSKIVNSLLFTCLDVYCIDMEFTVEEGFDKDSEPYVYANSYKWDANKIGSEKEKVKLKMSADIFSCIAFINSYIFDGVDNEHDLTLATVVGSKVLETPAEFFVVDKVESIISMAPAEVKVKRKGLSKLLGSKKVRYDTTLGIVLKLSTYTNNTDRDIVYLLTPFDIGVSFDESKFNGNTIEQIQDNYYGDSDQYVGTLMISNIRLHGVDKEYMIVRGKTKDKKVKLFLFDFSAQEELKHLINSY